jgi:hypothetical protein
MRNGTHKNASAKKAIRKRVSPGKPVFNLTSPGKNGRLTPEQAVAYEKYLRDLRAWLWSLPESRFDREIRKLSATDLFHLNWQNTFDNYQKAGPMRALAKSAL